MVACGGIAARKRLLIGWCPDNQPLARTEGEEPNNGIPHPMQLIYFSTVLHPLGTSHMGIRSSTNCPFIGISLCTWPGREVIACWSNSFGLYSCKFRIGCTDDISNEVVILGQKTTRQPNIRLLPLVYPRDKPVLGPPSMLTLGAECSSAAPISHIQFDIHTTFTDT